VSVSRTSPGRTSAARRPGTVERPRRSAARRAQSDGQTVIVAFLSFAATGLAVYDLLLLALAAQ
jgi:hypothetical protein